jgi:hypothetical protein
MIDLQPDVPAGRERAQPGWIIREMSVARVTNATKRLRWWWASPARTGIQRLIAPWEYRHLRVFGITRLACGGVAVVVGVLCLAYGGYGWAAFFLALGALSLAGGFWELALARSARPGT